MPGLTAAGTTYYVSNSTGNDSWLGTQTQPWKTLTKVSSLTFQPGDQILLKCGDTWSNQELILNGSSNIRTQGWITVGAYGTGDKPILSNPSEDHTLGLIDWSVVIAAAQTDPNYAQYADRDHIKIAIKVEGSGWKIQGLEITGAEEGIHGRDGVGYWIEDIWFHDLPGFTYPKSPGWPDAYWDPWPWPYQSAAIAIQGDYVTIKDIVIERNTGDGIHGYFYNGLVENVYLDYVYGGGLHIAGNDVLVKNATVLNSQKPDCYYGPDIMDVKDSTNLTVDNCEMAYVYSGPGSADESPFCFSGDVNLTVKNCFLHDNQGPPFSFFFNGSFGHYFYIENNVCYNNGLAVDYAPDKSIAFFSDCIAIDAQGSSEIIFKNNQIYKAFPNQILLWHYNAGVGSEAHNDFTYIESHAPISYTGNNNQVYEYGTYSLPLPVPTPPAISQTNLADTTTVTVSSGSTSAANVKDGNLSTEWTSTEAKPWVKYTWGTAQTINRIRLFDKADLTDWATSGKLTFSDGSSINVTGGLLNNGMMREVVFDASKTVTWVQFTVTRNTGTNVGLSEMRIYNVPSNPTPAPTPSAGTFTITFEDRPIASTLLTGKYPNTPNGINWSLSDWTTIKGSGALTKYLYVNMPSLYWPAWNYTAPQTVATRTFTLPAGKILKNFKLAMPAGTVIYISQGTNSLMFNNGNNKFKIYNTGWTTAPSDIVRLYIDATDISNPNNNGAMDIKFDNIVFGD
jgi:hypothetical protein